MLLFYIREIFCLCLANRCSGEILAWEITGGNKMYKDLDAAVQDKQDIVIHLANENANHRKVKEEKIHSLA